MSFLQPLLLAGLPLIGLPILIHLINRWRHKTLPWAAMMFLLDAKRMNRGIARLRFWLIMSMRMLAVAALFIAMARPLASGWLGLGIGGRVETTLVLLDRSASMEQQELGRGNSKRLAALTQLTEFLGSAKRSSRIVLIESTQNGIREFESAAALLDSLDTSGTATTADIPGLLEKGWQYVTANETGRTDVWICSDLRESDWNAEDARWASVRDRFQTLDGVKFYLLAYPEPARDNVAVSVTNVRQRSAGSEQELVFDIQLNREGNPSQSLPVPCEITINGARSVINIEMTGNEYLLQGHQVPLGSDVAGGWGRVSIPADDNPHDNTAYFVFAEPPVHHTTIVADDQQVAETLRIAATAPLDPAVPYAAEILTSARADDIDFGGSSLILWQAGIPVGALADQLKAFAGAGRPVIFFPPTADTLRSDPVNELFGVGWGDWQQASDQQMIRVVSWRGDSDLWAHSASGESLGVGDLQTFAYRKLHGDTGSPLARLEGGHPLLYRVPVAGGAAYFCTTLPSLPYSSLARDGLPFYALVQRALSYGAATQSSAQKAIAGASAAKEVVGWQPSDSTSAERLPSARWLHAGVFQREGRRVALCRADSEDMARILHDDEVDALFRGLDLHRITQSTGNAGALASEVWRALLVVMGVALIAEALLCLPEPKPEVVR